MVLPAVAHSDDFLVLNGVKYRFSQVNLHYAQNDNEGSAHTFHGHHYPAELQLDWYKPEYGSLTNAARYPDGIVKIAIQLMVFIFF